jgi:vitamin B12 transporter
VFTGGVRVDDNDRFGRAVSPSGGASYQLGTTGTRLRANYAQGFKAPTLNQLFFPGFGNPNLDAESSSEVTVGFDQSLLEGRGLASASYFHRKVKDLIVGVPQPDGLLLAENVGDAKTDGAEFAVDAELWSGIHGGGSYTYLNLDASPAGRVRRPRHSGSVHVLAEESGLVQSGDRLTADVRLLLVGDRADFDPTTFAVVNNEGYKRVDLALAYSWPLSGYVQRLKIFARVENVFDERYDEVLGFGSRPTNFLAGVGGEL